MYKKKCPKFLQNNQTLLSNQRQHEFQAKIKESGHVIDIQCLLSIGIVWLTV